MSAPSGMEFMVLIGLVGFFYILYVIYSFFAGYNEKTIEIDVFNISDIGRPYKAIKMVQGQGNTEKKAMRDMKEQAIKLNADAIVGASFGSSSKINRTLGSAVSGQYEIGGIDQKFVATGTAVKYTREQVAPQAVPQPQAVPVSNEPTSIEKLEKYAAMYDKGHLTEEEFNKIKQNLL